MADIATLPTESSAASRRPPGVAGRGRWSRNTVEVRVLGVLRWVVIIGLMLFTLFPFYYMVLLSLRDLSSLLQAPAKLLPTLSELTLTTYRNVLASTESGGQGFLRFMANSGMVALGTVVLTLAFAIPGAYAVARLRFPGHRQVSVLFLSVYLFPSILLAVPLFVFFTRVGLRGSLGALLLVYVSQTVAVSIYMLRNYFQTVPASIEEAAAVDGAS
ncbi:MAG: carbohydrate ABC transporter permease, partial [Nocardioidaceae bacterium]